MTSTDRNHSLLQKALLAAECAIEEATDIMHYEDGQPVTALEGWEIERAYTALRSVLVEIHEALTRNARNSDLSNIVSISLAHCRPRFS
jgi:hypothetical protein